MSTNNEIIILLRKLIKLIDKKIDSTKAIPEGIIEWDNVESKFYKSKNEIHIMQVVREFLTQVADG